MIPVINLSTVLSVATVHHGIFKIATGAALPAYFIQVKGLMHQLGIYCL
jgi:hypothetical protein